MLGEVSIKATSQLLKFFTSYTSLRTYTMAIDINIVNNNDLPQAVLVLPEHLQPQPPLVADWCENCLPALAPRRFSAKAVEKALQERDCSRRNIYSNCAKCTEKHRTCVPVSSSIVTCFCC